MSERRSLERTIIESVAEGMVVLGMDGRALAWNANAEALLGVDGARVGRFDASDPGWRSAHREGSAFPFVMHAALATLHGGGPATNLVLGARRGDGALFWLAINTRLVQGAASQPTGVVVSFTDITELREGSVLRQARETQRDLMQRSPLAIISMDVAGTIQTWNPAATRIFGWSEREILGQRFPLAAEDGHKDLFKLLSRQVQTPLDAGVEMRLLRKDGSVVDVILHALPILERDGDEATGLIAMMADTSQRKGAERALRESEERHRSLVEQLPLATFVLAADGSFDPVYTSPQMQSLLDLRPMKGFSDWLDQVYQADRSRVAAEMRTAHQTGLARRSEYRMIDRHEGLRWIREESAAVLDTDGAAVVWQGFLLDVTEQKAAADRLEQQAHFDAQTGLPNHTHLVERLSAAIETGRRATPGVLVVELVRFRHMNSVLGRDAGDRLLREAGERLQELFGAPATVARIGGAKFAIALSLKGPGAVEKAVERLFEGMRQPFVVSRTPVRLDLCAGVATSGRRMVDAARLVREADIAASQAGELGVPWTVYSHQHDRNRQEELTLAAELPEAIELDQLRLHYQPVLDLRTGDCHRMEALLRWRNPRVGLVTPDRFMPIVEETALVGPFSLWVVAAAVVQWRRWRSEGLRTEIAVNVSARNLEDAGFVREAQGLIERAAASTASFAIEITESALVANAPKTLASLAALKELGFKVSIDDFGTGYSSLSYLQRLRVDEVKIDRSFVSAMSTDATAAAIVRSIIGLARDLGLQVVAEGVEDEATLRMLRDMDCDLAQGHLISVPLEADAVLGWMTGHGARAVVGGA